MEGDRLANFIKKDVKVGEGDRRNASVGCLSMQPLGVDALPFSRVSLDIVAHCSVAIAQGMEKNQSLCCNILRVEPRGYMKQCMDKLRSAMEGVMGGNGWVWVHSNERQKDCTLCGV